jgi:hypothetical protein
MKRRESPSALLILSAIDLLLASLVCGVVLMIALVGARSSALPRQSLSSSDAPVVLQVLFHKPPDVVDVTLDPLLQIDGAEGIAPQVAADFESLSTSPFGLRGRYRFDLYWWTLRVKADATQLTFSGMPTLLIATISLGGIGSYYVSSRCAQSGWTLKLGLRPVRVLDENCPDRADTGLLDEDEVPSTPVMIVTTVSPSSPAWTYLATLKSGNGMISTWSGEGISVPDDASTVVFKD